MQEQAAYEAVSLVDCISILTEFKEQISSLIGEMVQRYDEFTLLYDNAFIRENTEDKDAALVWNSISLTSTT